MTLVTATITAADASSRQRPTAAQVGFNGLAKRLLALQCLVALATLLALQAFAISIHWTSGLPLAAFDIVIAGLWVHLWRSPGRPEEWFVAETVAAFLLMVTASHVLAPAQYAAAAFKRPLIDAALASADAAVGINVAALAAWTGAHPHVSRVLAFAYSSFLVQLAVLAPIVGFVLRDRDAMWEAVFHYHVCAVITVATLALFPAASAFQFLHFQSTLDQTRFIAQFEAIRSGAFTTLRFDNLEGLVSMPSFHFAGALIVPWALRRTRLMFWSAVALNTLLAISTVFTGAHYAVDLAGTVAMFSVSLWVWNAYARHLLGTAAAEPTFAQTRRELSSSPTLHC